jgi:predicted regulator of Ras-like GTPase activity (Roadblock/LC7/MglB family)
LAQGDLERLVMFAKEGVMIVYPAGEAMLAVLVDKEVKPGMLLYAAARACNEIKEILGFEDEKKADGKT